MIDGNGGLPSAPFGWWEPACIVPSELFPTIGMQPGSVHLVRRGRIGRLSPGTGPVNPRLVRRSGELLCSPGRMPETRFPTDGERVYCVCRDCELKADAFDIEWPENHT